MRVVNVLLLATAMAFAGCAAADAERDDAADEVGLAGADEAAVPFVDRVWRVADGSDIAAGQLYVLLSEGTLVVASPDGTPSLGTWSYDGREMKWEEEGIAYRVELLAATRDEFRVRSHNPGGSIELRMVPAEADVGGRPID